MIPSTDTSVARKHAERSNRDAGGRRDTPNSSAQNLVLDARCIADDTVQETTRAILRLQADMRELGRRHREACRQREAAFQEALRMRELQFLVEIERVNAQIRARAAARFRESEAA